VGGPIRGRHRNARRRVATWTDGRPSRAGYARGSAARSAGRLRLRLRLHAPGVTACGCGGADRGGAGSDAAWHGRRVQVGGPRGLRVAAGGLGETATATALCLAAGANQRNAAARGFGGGGWEW